MTFEILTPKIYPNEIFSKNSVVKAKIKEVRWYSPLLGVFGWLNSTLRDVRIKLVKKMKNDIITFLVHPAMWKFKLGIVEFGVLYITT